MNGEKYLERLLKTLKPRLNVGSYVFCIVNDLTMLRIEEIILFFKEQEGYTVIVKKEYAESLKLNYTFTAAWITLTVHSSLEAVGLTAAFSTALSAEGISCNVVAANYHDHLFIAENDAEKAMGILNNF